MEIKKPGWLLYALLLAVLSIFIAAEEGLMGVGISVFLWIGVAVYFAMTGKD